mmetsp:Transcript_30879/g.43036  ORF Transcript_30879/g.43036 Transcript_30879/m.43036 type:complete len:88 (+) Transcript_30879:388-651(+)
MHGGMNLLTVDAINPNVVFIKFYSIIFYLFYYLMCTFNPWQKLRLKEKLNEMRGQVKFLNLPYFGYALFLWPKLTPSSEAAPADAGS